MNILYIFGKYENDSIHRVEKLIILLTNQYIFQTNMRSSRPNAKILKNVFKTVHRTVFTFKKRFHVINVIIITII